MEKHISQIVLLLLSSKDSPRTSLYRDKREGSVVMFGGVGKSYFQGALNWISLIKVGDWSVHRDW